MDNTEKTASVKETPDFNVSFSDYQDFVYELSAVKNETADMVDIPAFTWALQGLSAEVGEVNGVIEKARRKGELPNREDLLEELGDALFFFAACVNACNANAHDVLHFNIVKLTNRHLKGTLLERKEEDKQEVTT
jgi:NTP pyrophosphatase (non-canonical NTP hydrolase)